MLFIQNSLAIKTLAEEMAPSTVAPVETLCIVAMELADSHSEIRLDRLDHVMHVIGHECVLIDSP